jgi:hypothetical protein
MRLEIRVNPPNPFHPRSIAFYPSLFAFHLKKKDLAIISKKSAASQLNNFHI